MEYRLNKQTLADVLGQWNTFLRRKVHLIACGGTALTLMDVKLSTKDVDFMVPIETETPAINRRLTGASPRRTARGRGANWPDHSRAIWTSPLL